MDFTALSRQQTVKALLKLKRRATVPTQRNKGATFALNQALFSSYLKLAKETHGEDIHREVFLR